jgi:hypothetical protein
VVSGGGGGVGCSVPPFPGRLLCVGGWGLVGGVFDMWIVDASIWQPFREVFGVVV